MTLDEIRKLAAARDANGLDGFPAGRGRDRSDPTLFEAMQRALDRVEPLARGGKLYIAPSILPKGSAAGLEFSVLQKAACEAAAEMLRAFPEPHDLVVRLDVTVPPPTSAAVFHYLDECSRVLSVLCGFDVKIDVAVEGRPMFQRRAEEDCC